ncbi:ragulator complex protein lamtor4 [Anaeramoeba flamelloides]|uniref:Late endosomal/lysosomal adaptor and MAPK and MTOR activator 4 n=1 Tax=Anaeramoeba flamelloides TaxID=1746091 RepID=A0AAV7Z0E4_9EUKA|nr:ragulator complex protein lamtor4 [Anaeramoeba flamelloides]KAJ6241608.1 ragulator complex protein lamtor4 [Anaeramoeba flamelloides]
MTDWLNESVVKHQSGYLILDKESGKIERASGELEKNKEEIASILYKMTQEVNGFISSLSEDFKRIEVNVGKKTFLIATNSEKIIVIQKK